MLYWFFKWFSIGPLTRLLFRPWIEGEENLPESGRGDPGQQPHLRWGHVPAAGHDQAPADVSRPRPSCSHGRGIRGRITGWFMKSIGQLPMDRSGGRASATSMDGVLGVLGVR